MTPPDITHNNHYVPQFYLQNWSYDSVHVYEYSLLVPDSRIPYWKPSAIRYTAKWNDFYTRVVGDKEADDFEKWFNEEFETPAKPVFMKLLNDENISTEESIIISRYIAAQHIRTPARANKIITMLHEIVPDILKDTHEKLNSAHFPKATSTSIEDAELLPLSVSIDRENQTITTGTVIGKSMYLYALKYLLKNTAHVMDNYPWQIIHAAEGISFPTSDDPVICMNFVSENNYDFGGGWGRKYGTIIMPISPSKLLFTEIGVNNSVQGLDYSLKWSNFFRKIIIEHAHRYVYAIKPQKGMLAIHPRLVDRTLYLQEQEKLANWHQDQMEAEQALKRKPSNY